MLTNNFDIKSFDNDDFLNLLYKYVDKYLMNIDSFIDSMFLMDPSELSDLIIDTKFILTHVHYSMEEVYCSSDEELTDDELVNEESIDQEHINQLRSDLKLLIKEFPRKSEHLNKIENIKEELKRTLIHLKKTSDIHQQRIKEINSIPESVVDSFKDVLTRMENIASN